MVITVLLFSGTCNVAINLSTREERTLVQFGAQSICWERHVCCLVFSISVSLHRLRSYRRDLRPGRPEDDRFWISNTHSRCKRTERIRRLPLRSLSNDKLRRKTNITHRLQSCALMIKPLQESPRHFNQN